MKRLMHLLAIAALVIANPLQSLSQLYKVELDEKVRHAGLIIEGRVTDKTSFWNNERTMIYTANTIEVYKVFKGAFPGKTIEVITHGGAVDNYFIEASDLLTLEKDQTGIFFCYPNTLGIASPASRSVLYDVYGSDQGFLRYDFVENKAFWPFENYDNIEQSVYPMIMQKTGQSMKVMNRSFNVTAALQSTQTNGPAGIAAITSFSPTTVNGGALNDPNTNVLTINGSGFGSVPSGQCAVRFKDGNSASTTPDFSVAYNSPYISSWTDTKIILRVPTRAATGRIAVVSSTGVVTTSSATLNVYYSVLSADFNLSGKITPKETRMMNTNGSGGYSLRYCTNTSGNGVDLNTAPEKGTFQRALNTWKELVGVNFFEAGTTTIQKVDAYDGSNVIMFDNNNKGVAVLPSGTLATTYSGFSMCANPVFAAQKSGFDIVIRNNKVSQGNTTFTVGPCFPANPDIDLEMVLLHELGHALNLAHINDNYEGNFIPNLNPSKLMHYAVVNYVNRRSPDNSAYVGALYAVTPQGNNYGVCTGGYTSEMSPLSKTVISNDECPSSFPITTTTPGTVVKIDLTHATSNKFVDPQSSAINCTGNITSVTNNAYVAIKTNGNSNSTLKVSITGYTTSPTSLATCSGQGVRLTLYEVSSCPTAGAYPPPVFCRTFSGDGPLADITGLKANRNYLLFFDGLRNTKAEFNATLNGNALPITLSNFYGEHVKGMNKLYIDITQAINVASITIERSSNGAQFSPIGNLQYTASTLVGKHTYTDGQPLTGENYYRLAIRDNDGSLQYSNVIVLNSTATNLAYVYPNPVKDLLNLHITAASASRYLVQVYDMAGRLLINRGYELNEGANRINMPVGNIQSGAYAIRVTDASGNTVLRQHIIKQ